MIQVPRTVPPQPLSGQGAQPEPARITRSLYAYQLRIFNEICATQDDLLVQLPTGSGKTLILSTATVSLLGRVISHAVVAAPQLQIERGFSAHGLAAVRVGEQTVHFAPGVIRSLGGARKAARVLSYCRQPAPGYAIATTHQTLGGLDPEQLPDSLAGHLLVIDEAHHAAEEVTRLGGLLAAWRRRGGRLILATATDFRTDGRPVRPEGMRVLRRSLAEHMQDPDGPFAPGRVESEIVPIDLIDRAPTPAEVSGDVLPGERHQQQVAARMVERWQELGRPRTIVRAPVLTGGSSGLVRKLIAGFRVAGARVYDATGTRRQDQARFQEFLRRQREDVSAFPDACDVVVGIQRVLEGTDWPWCSDVFVVGIPRSLQQVVQLLGRATRLKHWPSYPALFRDRARVTFFVPTGGRSALGSLNFDHSKKVLFLTAFLADTETGQQWLFHDDIRRGSLRGLGDEHGGPGEQAARWVHPSVLDNLEDLLDPRDAAAGQLILAEILADARAADRQVTPRELAAAMSEHGLLGLIPEERRAEVVPRLVVQVLRELDGQAGRVSRAVSRRIASVQGVLAGAGGEARKALARVWEEILEEFRDVTLTEPATATALARQIHQLSGSDIVSFAGRLREGLRITLGAPIAVAELHEEIWDYHQRYGTWPSVNAGFVERFEAAYGYLDHCLRVGQRGLGPGSSLYQECVRVAGARGVPIEDRRGDDTPWTLGMIQGAIREHHRKTGRFPVKDDEGERPLGVTWGTLDYYLRTGGFHALAGGTTLARQVLAVRRALGMVREAEAVTEEQVLAAVADHREATGSYPDRASRGEVPRIGGAWGSLNNRLRKGLLGAPASLADLVRKVRQRRGDLPPVTKRPLTRAAVHAAIVAYRRQHGTPPTRQTGGLSGLGIAWGTLDNLLKRGGRGLPGRSSLAREARLALKEVGPGGARQARRGSPPGATTPGGHAGHREATPVNERLLRDVLCSGQASDQEAERLVRVIEEADPAFFEGLLREPRPAEKGDFIKGVVAGCLPEGPGPAG
jgi:hypothetical protein